ncbi:SagB/ThcOx family dehydrogenase [Methylocystis parvus]|uniref:SagB/ThcOx family dehydrogenase n=1 Tax=Methylocystis parvus TaxID=134 RepID=A0A6B8M3A2_9HYPH|nr:SagB/ThcOx family dehydrogenase [Methylocystis parvus]QGM96825.1 SagB/ThcOx family dehydrogenase [Methylocystis parvus]WBJ99297.1 SagB/ThcOx family dehydrogenase [Methylocystis parvus OBBP]
MNAHPDGLPTDIRGYHARTKHAPSRYALGPAFLDWTSQPSPYRRFDGARLIELPLGEGPGAAFPGPAPVAAPLDRRSLGLFLELAFGLSAWKSVEGSTWAVRNNPSSGNLHPTEAYLLANALDGVSDAACLFHYAPLAHGLEERARYEAARMLPEDGFLVALSAVPWREAWKYGERAFRYCQLDAGHAIGSVAQAAAALGWRVQALAFPSDDDIAALIGLNRADAFHRREEERPDILLWLATGDAALPLFDLEALIRAPHSFHGAANRLSEDHDGWPIIDRAIRLTHKPATPPLDHASIAPASAFAGPPVGNVVRARRSVQRMDGVSTLPLKTFQHMLAATLPGAAPLLSAFPWPPRLALIIYAHRIDGLEPGLYVLARDDGMAARLRAACSCDFAWAPTGLADLPLFRLRAGGVEREATRAACLQPIAGKGCFSVAMIADFERALEEEGAFAYRRLHWEAGLIGQVLYLWATAAGLAGTGIGCFFDDEVHAFLGLPAGDMRFQDVYHFTVGGAVEDARILTLPPYPEERRSK